MADEQLNPDHGGPVDNRKRLEEAALLRGMTVQQLIDEAVNQYLHASSGLGGAGTAQSATAAWSNIPPVWLLGPKPVSQGDLRAIRDLCGTLHTVLTEAVEQVADSGQEPGPITLRAILQESENLLEAVRANATALDTFDAPGNTPMSYERLFRKLLNFDLVEEMVADPVRRRELKRSYRRLYWFSLRRLSSQLRAAARRRSETARFCPIDADIQGQFVDGLVCSYHLNRLRIAGILHGMGLRRPAARIALGSVTRIESALQAARV